MMRPAAEKIVEAAEAARAVESWRGAGEPIVVTRGAFDLLDAGTVRHLGAARAWGRLVVGVADDRAAAGVPGTPVLTADDRAALVAALRPVDLVVILDAPHAGALLAALRPDVLALPPGAAAGPEEREAARAAGCAVVTAGDPDFGPERAPAARVRAIESGR